MKLHNITILIIAVSMVILGIVSFITSLAENYGTTADLSSLEKTRARLNTTQQQAQELSDDLTNFKLESIVDFFTIPYKMIKIGWKIIKTIFGSWVTVGTMTTETAKGISDIGIPLPSWLIPSIIAMIVISLVAIIVYAFFKWKFED